MVSILNKILILIAALLIIFIAGILLLRKLTTDYRFVSYRFSVLQLYAR